MNHYGVADLRCALDSGVYQSMLISEARVPKQVLDGSLDVPALHSIPERAPWALAGSLLEELRVAALHFIGTYGLDVLAEQPLMTERVTDGSGALSVKLVLQGPDH